MRRILYALALVALLAGPVLGKTTTWTFGADPDTDWLTAGNWSNGVAIADDTIDISSTQVPTNIPVDAGTFNFSISNAVAVTLSDWLNTGATGDVTIPDADAIITTGANVAGNVSITSKGTLTLSDGTTVAGTVTMDGGFVYLYGPYTGTATVTGLITIDNGAILQVPDVLDVNGGIVVGAGGARIYSNGEIRGCVNAAGNDILWVGTGIITVDEDGDLDLGMDGDNDQAVTVTAETVAIGDSFRCDSFTLNAVAGTPELTGGDNTITVGAGGLTWTAGALDAAGTLNFIVAEEAPTALSWNSYANRIGTLTLNADAGTTGGVRCEVFAGTGALTTNNVFQVAPRASNFWTNTATHVAGINPATIWANGSYSNATLMDLGDVLFAIRGGAHTTKLTGGLICAALTMDGTGAHTLDMDGGNLTCTTISFDENLGAVKLGEGDATITGAIGLVAAETGCSFDFETSNVTLGGGVTGAGIAFGFGSVVIEASATITIDLTGAASIANTDGTIFANAQALTISNVDYATTTAPIICVSCTDGTGNGVGVEFQEPARMLMGIGF